MADRLITLHPHAIPDAWPDLRAHIVSACERSSGKYQAADILAAALAGRMQIWVVVDDSRKTRAVVITEIIAYPRCKVCAVLACTGEGAEDWVDLIAGIESWARDQGCRTVEPRCRPGWERVLKHFGYRKTHSILEKML